MAELRRLARSGELVSADVLTQDRERDCGLSSTTRLPPIPQRAVRRRAPSIGVAYAIAVGLQTERSENDEADIAWELSSAHTPSTSDSRTRKQG